mgnify:CR=1 FL=1
MQQLASYLSGAWQTGRGRARTIHHAITGAALCNADSAAAAESHYKPTTHRRRNQTPARWDVVQKV